VRYALCATVAPSGVFKFLHTMELTTGSISLSASINETLNCRMSVDTALAQVCRVTPISRVSVFGRRPFVSAEHTPFLRGGRSSPSWRKFSEDIPGLGCRLYITGQKKTRPSHNSRWQATAVAEFSGTDTEDIGSSARDDLSNADVAVYIIEEYVLKLLKTQVLILLFLPILTYRSRRLVLDHSVFQR
jgi:hypothetical protein